MRKGQKGVVYDPSTYPCGHPRTPENTHFSRTDNKTRCRTCRRRLMRESINRVRAAKRLNLQSDHHDEVKG